jgi:NAD(P)-dependent dehydrogenase (short-subunit alcohol dehydrogenase family)
MQEASAAAHSQALVVGANRGIGLGLVQILLSRGWHVVATSRPGANISDLSALGAAEPGALTLENLDLSDPEQLDAFPARLQGPPLDVAIFNGATPGPEHRSVQDATVSECAELFFVNALGPARLAWRLIDSVTPDTAVFAFISSVQGSIERNPTGANPLYRASKAALNSLSRSFYLSTGREFSVLSLHPGWVKTPIGGPDAPVEVLESAQGLVDVICKNRHRKEHQYLDYLGAPIPW